VPFLVSSLFRVVLFQADEPGRDRGGGVKVKRSASVAENDSRSGIDHLDTVVSAGVDFSAEDAAEPGRPGKRNRTSYGRHTPGQIQELQAYASSPPTRAILLPLLCSLL
jgi:homeobox-leucine zipper protein